MAMRGEQHGLRNHRAWHARATRLRTCATNASLCASSLRLRGLGGQITVDFAPMRKNDRKAVESAFRKAFAADGVQTTLAGWTPLGHFELLRKRERRPLTEVLRDG